MGRGGDSPFRFLLKGVQHDDRILKAHSVDGAVGVAAMVLHHFKDRSPAKARQRLGMIVLQTNLSEVKGKADSLPYAGGKL